MNKVGIKAKESAVRGGGGVHMGGGVGTTSEGNLGKKLQFQLNSDGDCLIIIQINKFLCMLQAGPG